MGSQMGSKDLWTFLFLLGVVLFNWPLLSIFEHSAPYYLFGLWAVFILVTVVLLNLTRKNKAL
ncbi:MAG: hypothetical protein P8Y66_07280 [Nitrospirota bacterium]